MSIFDILGKFSIYYITSIIVFFIFKNVDALETSLVNKKQGNIYIIGGNLGYELNNIDKYEFIEIVFNEISKLYNVDGRTYYRLYNDKLVMEMLLNETMGMRLLSKYKTIPSDFKFPLYIVY